jgi:hypothetical protein
MSYKTFMNTAKKLGFKPGEIPFSDHELPEIKAATAERKAKGLMAPGFFGLHGYTPGISASLTGTACTGGWSTGPFRVH